MMISPRSFLAACARWCALVLVFATVPTFAQSPNTASQLTVFDVDASQFPQMKARFLVFDTTGKPLQNTISPQQIVLRENGVSRTVLGVIPFRL
ncbi:MAG: hypothetical protein EAZ92_12635 [Candidatus Kapaibacterium sp.]|nr:MAG: hypothetical protein EAZ92_12635 [Candidatus Kapabacteria bacterium]